jgi:hypothetical protein
MPTKEILIQDVSNWDNPKKHICCVVDTECTFMSEQSRLVYEFAWVISDLNDIENKNYLKKHFYISETVSNPEAFLKFTKKYTDNGIPKINFGFDSRYPDILKNCFNPKDTTGKVANWEKVIKEFNSDCKNRGVDTITAYNFMFDFGINGKAGVIRKTHSQYTDKAFYFPNGVKHFCLMEWVCRTLINRNYFLWIDSLSVSQKTKMQTAKGNNSYSAESVLKYLNQDVDYTEQHTALRDCCLEMNLAKIVYARYWKTLKYFTGTPKKSLVKMVSWKKIADEVSSKDKMAEKISWLADIMGNNLVEQLRLELKD